MEPARCPSCNYGPLKPTARACIRCGHVLRALQGTLAQQYAGAGTSGPVGDVVVEAACSACKRAVRVKEEDALRRIATGRGACQFCRGSVSWPPGIVEKASGWQDPGVRMVHDGPCVCCGRGARTRPGQSGGQMQCPYCSMTFVLGSDARPSLPPPEPTPMATEETVHAWMAGVPQHWPYPMLAHVFLQRARAGELSQGEAEGLLSCLWALERWTFRNDRPQLPLPLAEAQDVVRHVLFRAPTSTIDDGEVVFNFTLESTEGSARGMSLATGKLLAVNAIGLGLLAATGTGFVATGSRDQDATEHNVGRVRVTFLPVPGGVELVLARQKNEETRRAFTPGETVALAQATGGMRHQLLGYYAVLALYGPRARGTPALQASLPCLQARLQSLGVPNAEVEAPRLRFVHAPHPLTY